MLVDETKVVRIVTCVDRWKKGVKYMCVHMHVAFIKMTVLSISLFILYRLFSRQKSKLLSPKSDWFCTLICGPLLVFLLNIPDKKEKRTKSTCVFTSFTKGNYISVSKTWIYIFVFKRFMITADPIKYFILNYSTIFGINEPLICLEIFL